MVHITAKNGEVAWRKALKMEKKCGKVKSVHWLGYPKEIGKKTVWKLKNRYKIIFRENKC